MDQSNYLRWHCISCPRWHIDDEIIQVRPGCVTQYLIKCRDHHGSPPYYGCSLIYKESYRIAFDPVGLYGTHKFLFPDLRGSTWFYAHHERKTWTIYVCVQQTNSAILTLKGQSEINSRCGLSNTTFTGCDADDVFDVLQITQN